MTDPIYTHNLRYSFDHAPRDESDGVEWVILVAKWASVFITHEQHIYLDLEWDYMGEATAAGIVFG